jgi:hypothetical protein
MSVWQTHTLRLLKAGFGLAVLGALTFSSTIALAASWSTKDAAVEMQCGTKIPAYEFDATTSYSTGNAFLALLAATVAENWTDARIKSDLKAWGFQDTKLIGKILLGSYGYITENDQVRVLAFRGTHSLHEGLIDATAMSSSYADIGLQGRGHSGMKLAFKVLWSIVRDELAVRQAQNPKPLVIVGHSLGGSLAFLHALRLAQLDYPILGLYTAAEPRIGDATLMAEADALIGDRFYRLENAHDPVPQLPPTAANAQAFADVFLKERSLANGAVRATVEHMNYAPLPGWTLQMDVGSFQSKFGLPAEQESELNFLNGIESAVVKSDNVKDVFVQVKKHVQAHLGDSYVCNFLKLIDQGFHPQVP